MKRVLLVFIVLLAFCSCAKNYPQMVKDRVEQYKNEGKIIIAHSDDDTGKEHYIVYGDMKTQVIGVDTLGDSVKELKLNKMKYEEFFPVAVAGKGLVFDSGDYLDADKGVILNNKGQFTCKLEYINGVKTLDKVECYKDKYIFLTGDGCCGYLIFLDKPKMYYIREAPTFEKNGDISLNIFVSIAGVCSGDWAEYYDSSISSRIGRDYEGFSIKVTITPEGEIKPASRGICSTIEIPTEAFANWESLYGYLKKIAEVEDHDYALDWD